MKFLISLIFVSIGFCQDIQDVYNFSALATKQATVLGTITGSDGTKCTLAKQPTTTIYLTLNCLSQDGKLAMKPIPIQSSTSVSGTVWLSLNSVMIAIGLNPTSSSVPFGSVGTAPAKGVCFQLVADGNLASLVQGTAVWP